MLVPGSSITGVRTYRVTVTSQGTSSVGSPAVRKRWFYFCLSFIHIYSESHLVILFSSSMSSLEMKSEKHEFLCRKGL